MQQSQQLSARSTRSEIIKFRVTPEERAAYIAAAGGERELSAYIRGRLNEPRVIAKSKSGDVVLMESPEGLSVEVDEASLVALGISPESSADSPPETPAKFVRIKTVAATMKVGPEDIAPPRPKRTTRVQTVECPKSKDGAHHYSQEKGSGVGIVYVCACGDRTVKAPVKR